MSQFFKTLFASCLGVLLAGLAIFGLSALIVGQMISSADEPADVKSNSVLHLTFDQVIPERTNNMGVNFNGFEPEEIIGLHDMITAIEAAAEDNDIKGIYLDLSAVMAGQATKIQLHEALMAFKEKSDKFIVAWAPFYDQNTYLMASVADEIFIHPMGGIDFRGFASMIPFAKDMFDKIGVEWEIYYAGKFKSATEPLRRNNMSEENRQQIRVYLDGLYAEYLQTIADARGLEVSALRQMAVEYSLRDPEAALENGMVDQIGYKDDVLNNLRTRIGLDEDAEINTVSVTSYFDAEGSKKDYSEKNEIAVIYAEGDIMPGEAEPGSIGSKKYTGIIRKVREDDDIKAIVLRVNSPGGSALASEDIWYELELARKAGKPVVVTMGDLAASGGYYIAAAADSIFALPSTLTGSIGVFGMIPQVQKLFNDKMGVHMDTVKTAPLAAAFSPFYKFSDAEGRIIQEEINRTYMIFKKRVSEGRNMTMEQVEEIAQGRVWTGTDALRIGLVDALGDIDRALASAASLAGIDSYRISEYPKIKPPLEQLIDQLTNQNDGLQSRLIRSELGEMAPYYDFYKELKSMEGPQARLPYIINY
jgi:protease-4